MNFEIQSIVINLLTALIFISPLLTVVSLQTIVFISMTLSIGVTGLYLYFSLPRSTSRYDQFDKLTIAHRGGRPIQFFDENDEFPENSLAAFRWASQQNGADAIELDVWLSKDAVAMVNHDEYLGNTFHNSREFIGSLTCANLRELRYLRRNKVDLYQREEQERMPTLEEVIKLLEPTKLKLMIEIKERRQIKRMAQIIDDLFRQHPFLYERAFCASFHPYNIYSIRKINPHITTGFLYASNITSHIIDNSKKTPQSIPVYLEKNLLIRGLIDKIFDWFHSTRGLTFLGADLLCIEHGHISLNLLNRCRKSSIIVCAWSVNQPEQKQWLTQNRVTVITDTLF